MAVFMGYPSIHIGHIYTYLHDICASSALRKHDVHWNDSILRYHSVAHIKISIYTILRALALNVIVCISHQLELFRQRNRDLDAAATLHRWPQVCITDRPTLMEISEWLVMWYKGIVWNKTMCRALPYSHPHPTIRLWTTVIQFTIPHEPLPQRSVCK